MSDTKETVHAIFELLDKLVGNRRWILLASLCAVSWCGYFMSNYFWLFLCSIFFSLVIVLSLIATMCEKIRVFKRNRRKKESLRKNQALQEQKRLEQEQKHASLVWRYVAYFTDDKIETAVAFLSFPIHDGNKYIRFIKRPKQDDWKRDQVYWALFNIIPQFQYKENRYSAPLLLLSRTEIQEGFYVEIEPYFFRLLENYRDSKNWEKL